MKIGFIGAGKAGCSIGKYLSGSAYNISNNITGYHSLIEEEARWAAKFTDSEMFDTPDDVVQASDSIIISTPDGAVKKVWDSLNKELIKGRIICHLSGSLSSDVFSGIEEYGGYPISIHPLFAFSDKESAYKELNNVCFTLEGHPYAVSIWKQCLNAYGNKTVEISKDMKPKYHAAASVLSNHVIAVLETGYQLLIECGFDEEQARHYTSSLVRDNVEHVIKDGTVKALTGPIERNDIDTVKKHLDALNEEHKLLYKICGSIITDISKKKNSDRDYGKISELLNLNNMS